jgi:hypothetical protein
MTSSREALTRLWDSRTGTTRNTGRKSSISASLDSTTNLRFLPDHVARWL